MTVTDVLTLCDVRGVQLIIDGHELRARGRKGAVSDALKQGIVQHKADLIELVYEREEAAAIEDEGRLSDIGREALQRRQTLVTVASGVDPALANIAARDEGLRAVAEVFGGLEIISACIDAQRIERAA
jgi:hypothetical protein